MNTNIPYLIDTKIEQLIEDSIDPDTGEITDDSFDLKLKSLEADKDEAIESIGLYYKDLQAEAKAVKDEKDNLAAKQKAIENRAESVKKQLGRILSGEKFKTPRLSISYRKSRKVIVDDILKLPPDCLTWKDPEADKTKIKKLLETEGKINGAHIEESNNVIIK